MGGVSTSKPNTNTRLPFVVEATRPRSGQIFHVLGETIVVKLSGADTESLYAIVEETTPPMSGPPLHQHSREDEWFYILEGEYRFQIGEQFVVARTGDSLFAPRGIPHTFQNVSSRPSRFLGLAQPAGIEGFFKELANATAAGLPDPNTLKPIFHRYGLELLGPPLSGR